MMNIFYKSLITCLISFIFGDLFCQKELSPEINRLEGKFFQYQLSSKKSIAATYFYFDKKGFLWIGTYSDLRRFDGSGFRKIAISNTDSTGFTGQQISGIAEDSEGNLWISTFGGLNCLNIKSGLFQHFIPDSTDFMSDNNFILNLIIGKNDNLWMITCGDVFSFNKRTSRFLQYKIDSSSKYHSERPIIKKDGQLVQDKTGRVWIATPDGLYMQNGSSDTLRRFLHAPGNKTSISSNKISCITEDLNGTIWVATRDRGLNKVTDPDKGIFERIDMKVRKESGAKFDTINTLITDMDGSLWVFGNETFGCYSDGNHQFKGYYVPLKRVLDTLHSYYQPFRINYPDTMTISSAFQTIKDEIWFHQPIDGLMFRFSKNDEKLTLYTVPFFNNFHAIADKTGSFWFSCPADIIYRFVPYYVKHQTVRVQNSNLVLGQCWPRIAEDKGKKIWLALSTGIKTAENTGINRSFKLKKYYLPGGDSIAGSIIRDHQGNIWMSRPNGLITKVIANTGMIKNFQIPGNTVGFFHNMKEDSRGNIWITDNYTIYRIQNNGNEIKNYSSNISKLNNVINAGMHDFLADSNNRIWSSVVNNGLWIYNDLTGELSRVKFDPKSKIELNDICAGIEEDKNGVVWFLFCFNGLLRFDPVNKYLVKIDPAWDVNSGSVCYQMQTGNDGKIIVTQNNGLSVYEPGLSNGYNVKFIPFNLSTFTCDPYVLNSGDILLIDGTDLRFFPKQVPDNTLIPDIYITSILINNIEFNRLFPDAENVMHVKRLDLSNRQNNLRIEFAALNYLEPERNMYRYIMKGIEKDTVSVTSGFNFSEYKQMQPGKYTFWVTGSNNDGYWNASGKTIEIIIHPPWYKSGLSVTICLLIAISTVVLYIKLRTRRLEREKLNLEIKISERTEELEKKNMQIEEMDRLKTRFFTEISHEIRTPLTLITGATENLMTEPDGHNEENRARWMEILSRNAKRLANLVNQLLDISRIDAGKMKLSISESDIISRLRTIIYEYLSMAESRRIHFSVDIPDEPFVTFFDRDKIEKIISNLLVNAFKFTPSFGTVSCSISVIKPDRIDLPYSLFIGVKDTGAGISKDNIEKIFDRFYRVEGQWEKDGTGIGIGLSLVKELVSLLHGTIAVESEPESGSNFTVKIPLGKDHLADNEFVLIDASHEEDRIDYHPAEKQSVRIERETSERKISLLVVEDNKDLRTLIRSNLPGEYYVFEADNGKEGVNIAFSRIPDIVITDLIMPGMDGLELCKRLKSDERTSHIPVIMLTAKATTEEKIEGLSTGADDYIYKPFDINELKARISNLLVQREKLRLRFGMLTGFELHDKALQSVDEKFMLRISTIISENMRDFDFDVGM
jgi:signal transduction histidine kinase/ligand-binding sensor domain-containing protein/ActR/RegA family two-component response regulator